MEDMMTSQELIERLTTYHNDVNPDALSQAAFDTAWANGYADPCGCDLCQVVDDLLLDRIDPEQPDGNELVAQAWRDFDEWHGDVCHTMPDHLTTEWEGLSMPMQIYFYNRERPAPARIADQP